jgi:uncharacterized protein YndB with AHSA1/START domain
MTPAETTAVERELRINARPETVFPFFTDPELMVRWMGTTAELDPRPGGALTINVDGGHVARGEYVEVLPHERVVFTWGWEHEGSSVRPGESTIEVTLAVDGDHTVVHFVHRDLPGEESVTAHTRGWDHYLERLEVAGAGGDAGPDSWAAEASAATD